MNEVITFPNINNNDEDKRIIEAVSTKSVNFNEIVTEAERIQAECNDHTIESVNPLNFFMNESGKIEVIADDGFTEEVGISRFALGQLGTKIGVPGNYIQKCIDSGRKSLAQSNVNSWIRTYKGGFFLRNYTDRIRGVLSPRYSAFDTPEVLNMISDNININDYDIKGNFLNEERLHLRLTGKDTLNIAGEDLFPGVFIDTSDVGRSTLVITFGIYKYVCTNGLVISRGSGVLYKQKHIGIDTKEFEYQIAASMDNIPMLISNAEEWVRKAKKESLDQEKMQAIMKSMHLNDKTMESVQSLMNERYDNSRWGFINGLTEVAQKYTLDRRLEIEKYAGNLLVA